MMKKHLKMIIDIVMLIFVIILMGYFTTETQIHEILGTVTIVLFMIHLFLNKQWLLSLRKGRYFFHRMVYLCTNISLIIALVFVIISSLMISSYVFSFLPFSTSQIGRNMHLASTSWLFILVSLHIGLHMNILASQMKRKMIKSTFEYIYYFILIVWYIYGIIAFKNAELYKDMFIISEFKFFDYQMNPFLFYFNYLSIVYFLSMTFHLLMKRKKAKMKFIVNKINK